MMAPCRRRREFGLVDLTRDNFEVNNARSGTASKNGEIRCAFAWCASQRLRCGAWRLPVGVADYRLFALGNKILLDGGGGVPSPRPGSSMRP
jgi:hypothetical protein